MVGFDPDEQVNVNSKPLNQQFREARLDHDGVSENQWPAQIDRAANDILYGIAIGKTNSGADIGGTIDRYEFPDATGEFYADGLRALAGERSDLARALDRRDPNAVGRLAFHLNEFRKQLRDADETGMDIDRAIEALVEKTATRALERSEMKDDPGIGLRQLRGSDSAADLVLRLFSDPGIETYADALVELLDTDSSPDGLLARLDEPRMTTPLWDHQKQALENWIENDQTGYVDMATATGKTVLGLGAIAARYGHLHPADGDVAARRVHGTDHPRVLVVAGTELLLSQWRTELDEHLDIPRDRTVPVETEQGKAIEFGWGTVEFRTAQSFLRTPAVRDYDLVILDEAHRYSKNRAGGRGWGDLFERLVAASTALLAMSGSVDTGWQGDDEAKRALETSLEEVYQFSIPDARERGVIADFSWEIRYVPTTETQEEELAEQTRQIRRGYDSSTGELNTDEFDIDPIDSDEAAGPFSTYNAVRSFAQSNAGHALRERSAAFDLFATALFTRRPIQWNLSPTDDAIVALVTEHAPERKTVVLVQNYDDVSRIGSRLAKTNGLSEEQITTLTSGEDDRMAKITRFNETDGGVIIGPGDLLGTGVDMPGAEIAINVSRGSSVNKQLIQRIGRVLRNPEGGKDARFYHLLSQPTHEAAIDPNEDGLQLLRQAAEFRALGETFREPPSFAVGNQTVGDTLAGLERAGDELIARRTDFDVVDLVEPESAVEALRDLRDAIQAANEDGTTNGSHSPSVVDFWSRETDDNDNSGDGESDSSDENTTGEDGESFPERNEQYEQYRFARDKYRATIGVANHFFDVAITPSYSKRIANSEEENADTAFHEHHYAASTNRSKRKRAVEGDAEPGSFEEYREAWPTPRPEDGRKVNEEVAAQIGIDYTEDEPLFFPFEDGELYEVSLGDGRVLTAEGIRAEDTADTNEVDDTPMTTVHLPKHLVLVVRAHLANGEDGDLDDQIESWTRELVGRVVLRHSPVFTGDLTTSTETVSLQLPAEVMSHIKIICDDHSFPFDHPDHFVEIAVRDALGLEPGTIETVSVELPTDLVQAVESSTDRDLEAIFENALEDTLTPE